FNASRAVAAASSISSAGLFLFPRSPTNRFVGETRGSGCIVCYLIVPKILPYDCFSKSSTKCDGNRICDLFAYWHTSTIEQVRIGEALDPCGLSICEFSWFVWMDV